MQYRTRTPGDEKKSPTARASALPRSSSSPFDSKFAEAETATAKHRTSR